MSTYFKMLLCIIISTLILSCEDIFEPDLSNKQLTILSPPNNFTTGVYSQTFWWEPLEYATEYNLQIVIPSFNNIQQLIVDTIVQSNKFTYSLNPGSYQWRVKAINSTSQTEFQLRNLIIDSLLDLSSQSIVLVSPIINYNTNVSQITFQWNSLFGTDAYNFQLSSNFGVIIIDTVISPNQLEIGINEGSYMWCVSGINSGSTTAPTCRNLVVDITPPTPPIAGYPNNNDTIMDSPLIFTWTSDSQSVGDSIFIYSDSTETNLLYSDFIFGNDYSLNTTSNTNYFWKLSSVDSAGNWSGYSNLFRIYIN